MSVAKTAIDIPDYCPGKALEKAKELEDRLIALTEKFIRTEIAIDKSPLRRRVTQNPTANTSHVTTQISIGSICDDILMHIFLSLPKESILKFGFANKRFHQLSKRSDLWHRLIQLHYPKDYQQLQGIPNEHWIIYGKLTLANENLKKRLVSIEKDRDITLRCNIVSLSALGMIYGSLIYDGVSYLVSQVTGTQNSPVLVQMQEYLKTHPKASLEEARNIFLGIAEKIKS